MRRRSSHWEAKRLMNCVVDTRNCPQRRRRVQSRDTSRARGGAGDPCWNALRRVGAGVAA